MYNYRNSIKGWYVNQTSKRCSKTPRSLKKFSNIYDRKLCFLRRGTPNAWHLASSILKQGSSRMSCHPPKAFFIASRISFFITWAAKSQPKLHDLKFQSQRNPRKLYSDKCYHWYQACPKVTHPFSQIVNYQFKFHAQCNWTFNESMPGLVFIPRHFGYRGLVFLASGKHAAKIFNIPTMYNLYNTIENNIW